MEDLKTTGLRKRQQIAKANRTMFLWVTAVSVIVGFAAVISLFLIQRIWFGERVLTEKNKTISTLKKNIDAIPDLRANVRLLDTDQGLKDVRLNDDDRPIQSVLDALPADANSTAFGSSLQSKLLSGINGLTIDTSKVDPVVGVETQQDTSSDVVNADNSSLTTSGDNAITFSLTVSTAASNPDALRQVLLRLERSIRAVDVRSLAITTQSSRLVLTASGRVYYEPAKTVELKDKVVRP
jgi:hypothetical protein